jgi:hypothetical protein
MFFHYKKYSLMSRTGKLLIFLPGLCVLMACNAETKEAQRMQSKIDSLQARLNKTYKPGLGEFMTGIQLHHAKLWFAGQNQNWPLADFEIHEIQEALDDINEFCKDRPEIKSIGMLKPTIDSMTEAIGHKDLQSFKNNFSVLTNTCNTCHKATDHGFNVVIIPTNPPVSNQDFRVAH